MRNLKEFKSLVNKYDKLLHRAETIIAITEDEDMFTAQHMYCGWESDGCKYDKTCVYGKIDEYDHYDYNTYEVDTKLLIMSDEEFEKTIEEMKKAKEAERAEAKRRTAEREEAKEREEYERLRKKFESSNKAPEKTKYTHHCDYFDCNSNENGYCWACATPVSELSEHCPEETQEQFEEYNRKKEI